MNILNDLQKRAFTLEQAAAICGVSYHTLYRAVCRGNLQIVTGFGRMMISDKELDRFLGKSAEYKPRRRRNKRLLETVAPVGQSNC
jgi:predicted site-specific integrase-resolvase